MAGSLLYKGMNRVETCIRAERDDQKAFLQPRHNPLISSPGQSKTVRPAAAVAESSISIMWEELLTDAHKHVSNSKVVMTHTRKCSPDYM